MEKSLKLSGKIAYEKNIVSVGVSFVVLQTSKDCVIQATTKNKKRRLIRRISSPQCRRGVTATAIDRHLQQLRGKNWPVDDGDVVEGAVAGSSSWEHGDFQITKDARGNFMAARRHYQPLPPVEIVIEDSDSDEGSVAMPPNLWKHF